jgi:murein L,D-transpeptidase YcbB/YkuD
MQTRLTLKLLACLILAVLMTPAVQAKEDLTTEIIRDKITQIRFFEEVKLGEAPIASTKVLPDIYEQRKYKPIWTDAEAIFQLLNAVSSIAEDGLNPQDYHLNELRLYHKAIQAIGTDDPWLAADFDILMTDSFIRLVYHLYFGKVDPATLNPGWNLSRQLKLQNPARVILEIILSGSAASTIESLKPPHPAYLRLKAALAKYRDIQAKGSWPRIPEGSVLRKGDRDPRVARMRQRLAMTDGVSAVNDDPEFFDESLEKAVKRFQTREEIDPDGVVGHPTLIELNYPVQWRIDQIRANLERMRWYLHDLPQRFVVVDIAGFVINYFEHNRIAWTTRAQVGDPYTQTPFFKAEIKYMVLNPTWTVPPGITKREYLPMMRQNPDYLKQAGLKIVDNRGKFVNPDKINWESYSNRAFPYKFFQEPGPTNPLGRIKFICPNPQYIYLHDTPEAEKFNETWRAFSGGCIRLEKPLQFAVKLLDNRSQWSFEKIQDMIRSGKTRTIFLPHRVPVMFLYITVVVEQNGMIIFRDDVYRRDEAVIQGLDAAFEFKTAGLVNF